MGWSPETLFAVQVAKAAGVVVADFNKRRAGQVWTSRSHFRTAVDDASEAVIRKMFHDQYPDHNMWSEEGGKSDRGSNFTWVWDAIDGTIPMFHGTSDHFSVCGALCDGNIPILGVANAVGRGEMYVAEVGKGSFCNDNPVQVSKEVEIGHVIIGIDSGKSNRLAHMPYLEKAFGPDGVMVVFASGCASVPLLLVASGAYHAYLATSLEPEDMAAAVVIIRGAGGKVTNLKGEEWRLGDVSILAANPILHEKLGKFFELF